MIMNLTELFLHIAQVRLDLEEKKRDLDWLLLTDPATGMTVRYQIECLEPRLAELERHARRLVKEREAALSAVS
jgi:hypothetical protein